MRVARGVGESCTQLELVHGGMPDRADHSLKAGRMEFVLQACVRSRSTKGHCTLRCQRSSPKN